MNSSQSASISSWVRSAAGELVVAVVVPAVWFHNLALAASTRACSSLARTSSLRAVIAVISVLSQCFTRILTRPAPIAGLHRLFGAYPALQIVPRRVQVDGLPGPVVGKLIAEDASMAVTGPEFDGKALFGELHGADGGLGGEVAVRVEPAAARFRASEALNLTVRADDDVACHVRRKQLLALLQCDKSGLLLAAARARRPHADVVLLHPLLLTRIRLLLQLLGEVLLPDDGDADGGAERRRVSPEDLAVRLVPGGLETGLRPGGDVVAEDDATGVDVLMEALEADVGSHCDCVGLGNVWFWMRKRTW